MSDTGPLGVSRVVTQWWGGGEQFSQTLETQKQQEHRQASNFSVVSSFSAAQPPPNPALFRTGPAFFVMSTASDGVQSGDVRCEGQLGQEVRSGQPSRN